MAHRTTILFDDETRKAARELAMRYDCSTSEAVRRAVIHQRDTIFGVSEETRRERGRTLEKLFDLFADNDAEDEIQRLKQQDDGF